MKIKIYQASEVNFVDYAEDYMRLHVKSIRTVGQEDQSDFINSFKEDLWDNGYFCTVVEKEINDERIAKFNTNQILNFIFELGNVDESFCEDLFKYISVLDVIELQGIKYIVMPMGFTVLE